ncbi:hypothetical protein L596_010489 [Steinernema carpocapsae]|uniref:Uncharacterized protein n=1 Tax=Steinernema carpocapsae TaxID=34508 RepID=A0A4U5PIM8_STECR|nr:hypothetical protein L596_010489 [Steinernema carpocapsae]
MATMSAFDLKFSTNLLQSMPPLTSRSVHAKTPDFSEKSAKNEPNRAKRARIEAATVSHAANAINCAHTPPIPANLGAKREGRPPPQFGTSNFRLAARRPRTTPILTTPRSFSPFSILNRRSAAPPARVVECERATFPSGGIRFGSDDSTRRTKSTSHFHYFVTISNSGLIPLIRNTSNPQSLHVNIFMFAMHYSAPEATILDLQIPSKALCDILQFCIFRQLKMLAPLFKPSRPF